MKRCLERAWLQPQFFRSFGSFWSFSFSLAGCALFVLACSQKTAPDPTGFYFVEGGQYYTEITRATDGSLRVFPSLPASFPQCRDTTATAEMHGDRLVVTAETYIDAHRYSEIKTFKPSKTQPGDWDLIEINAIGADFDPEKPPLPAKSMLHRGDSAAREYYLLLDSLAAPDWLPSDVQLAGLKREALSLAHSLVAGAFGDIHMRVLLLDALQRNQDARLLQAELGRCEPELRKDPYLIDAADKAARNLKSIQTDDARKNAWAELLQVSSRGLAAQVECMKSLPNDFTFRYPDDYFVAQEGVGNYLNFMAWTRVMHAEAMLAMLNGRPDDAFKINAAVLRIGQAMAREGTFTTRRYGISIRLKAIDEMIFHVLNVSDSADDLDKVWSYLQKLKSESHPAGEADLYAPLRSWARQHPDPLHEKLMDAACRAKLADAKFELLRMATAARALMLESGSFPARKNQFTPYLTSPPVDPFTSVSAMMIAKPDKFTAYSAGPDRDDDHASVSYDPTNGTFSNGDIWVEVPRVRQYPIPAGGLHGTIPEDIRRQMPNGLPPDGFSTTRNRPLTVGATAPLTIFSWGPDMDERVGSNGNPESADYTTRTTPEIQYDPTNGTFSNGDLILQLK